MLKATGIVRRTDRLGRIVIPAELRESYGLHSGSPVEIYREGDSVVLRPLTFEGGELDADKES